MIRGWRVEELARGDRAQWMALRGEDLCASEAGALFDAHKYTTRRRIHLAKAFGEPPEQNADMRRGKIMEPAVAEAIVVDCGWSPVRIDTYLRARADDPLVRMGASLDYRMTVPLAELLGHPKTRATAEAAGWADLDPGLLDLTVECKSVDMGVFEREWADGPPTMTVVQSAMQSLLAGADGGLVACLLDNRARELYLYAVPRHAGFEARLVDAVCDFWRAYEAGEEPPVVALDNGFMSDYFPASDDGEVVNLTDESGPWQALVAERERLKLDQKRTQVRIDEIEAQIKDRMRDAARAILPGWSITWRSDSRHVRSLKIERRSDKPTRKKR